MIAAAAYAAWSRLSGSKMGRAVAAVAAFAAVVWLAWFRGKSAGADDVIDDQREDYVKRREDGIAAARDADERGRTMTPEEQLADIRKNGGQW